MTTVLVVSHWNHYRRWLAQLRNPDQNVVYRNVQRLKQLADLIVDPQTTLVLPLYKNSRTGRQNGEYNAVFAAAKEKFSVLGLAD